MKNLSDHSCINQVQKLISHSKSVDSFFVFFRSFCSSFFFFDGKYEMERIDQLIFFFFFCLIFSQNPVGGFDNHFPALKCHQSKEPYQSFGLASCSRDEAGGDRKITTGITGLWQPIIYRNHESQTSEEAHGGTKSFGTDPPHARSRQCVRQLFS